MILAKINFSQSAQLSEGEGYFCEIVIGHDKLLKEGIFVDVIGDLFDGIVGEVDEGQPLELLDGREDCKFIVE